jgi:putative SOS response-associated peptidase YedK
MCGRFALTPDPDSLPELANTFGLAAMPNLSSRYNIAPSQPIAAVVQTENNPKHLQWLRWGLVPSWAKDPAMGNKLINARAETLADKHSFTR